MNDNFDIQWNETLNIGKEQWIELLKDENIFKQEDIKLLNLIYTSDNFMANAAELADKLNLSHFVVLNSQVGRLGKRISDKINIEAPKRKDGNGYNWWHIPFLGFGQNNKFYWILRPELKDAINKL